MSWWSLLRHGRPGAPSRLHGRHPPVERRRRRPVRRQAPPTLVLQGWLRLEAARVGRARTSRTSSPPRSPGRGRPRVRGHGEPRRRAEGPVRAGGARERICPRCPTGGRGPRPPSGAERGERGARRSRVRCRLRADLDQWVDDLWRPEPGRRGPARLAGTGPERSRGAHRVDGGERGCLATHLTPSRRMLLDAVEVLSPHIEHIVLVGAHTIYLHVEEIVTGVALFTKDADLALVPPLDETPDIDQMMRAAGFAEGRQPGIWEHAGGRVDLLVPEALADPAGRRAARLPGHGRPTARKVSGIEGVVVDNELRTIRALDPHDPPAHPGPRRGTRCPAHLEGLQACRARRGARSGPPRRQGRIRCLPTVAATGRAPDRRHQADARR